ncbi:MAG: hypothetical protein Tsb0017_04660 [Geothermobacteraceae bacterium]
MNLPDRFTLFHLSVAVGAVVGCLLLVLGASPASQARTGKGQLERDLARRARVEFLLDAYAPVQQLADQGRVQQALMKLEEIGRRYPGEAYGLLLKGRLLAEAGAADQAIAAYAAAVRGNPDFVEDGAPLAARDEIEQLVNRHLEPLRRRLADGATGISARRTMEQLRYLQSRLAGGCE